MSGSYSELLKRRAEAMARLAERLLEEGEYDLAVFNAEYAAQLYVKSLLYRLSGEEWRGHSVRTPLGALALTLEESGLGGVAERIYDFARRSRRALAELEEAHTRAIYGVLRYSREQAETLLSAAKAVIGVARRVEEEVFGG